MYVHPLHMFWPPTTLRRDSIFQYLIRPICYYVILCIINANISRKEKKHVIMWANLPPCMFYHPINGRYHHTSSINKINFSRAPNRASMSELDMRREIRDFPPLPYIIRFASMQIRENIIKKSRGSSRQIGVCQILLSWTTLLLFEVDTKNHM